MKVGDHEFAKGKNGVQHIFYGSSEVPMTWPLHTGDQYQTGFVGKRRMGGVDCADSGKRMHIF